MLLNAAFHLLHLITIVFCVFGWMFAPLQFANLLVLLAVAFSWFMLGYFFGFILFVVHWHLLRNSNEAFKEVRSSKLQK